MRKISLEELKARLDRGDNLKLLMANNEMAYNAMHIPGSLHFNSYDEAFAELALDDEIVVYCNDPLCVASSIAYRRLEQRGYQHLYHYVEGLEGWEKAGYPLEGEMVK